MNRLALLLNCLLILLILSPTITIAQSNDLYMPIEFKRAYEKGSRQLDGSVGTNYTQNRSEYKLKAVVDPHTKLLEGEANIRYFNNGTDTLKSIVFHTYHDFYRPESQKSSFFSDGSTSFQDHKGVVIEKLEAHGEAYDIANREEVIFGGTNYLLRLKSPLPPDSHLDLVIHWNYEIPGEGFERSGAIDSTSMFIGYWYPEIAVYDDISGWDRITYDAATEFYHDFSDYEVAITVPDNFMLWASVAPDNPEEVYAEEIRSRIAKAKDGDEPVQIWGAGDFSTSASGNKTWKYTAENFPDFSFALSDHFVWDAHMHTDKFGDYFLNTAYPENHPEFGSVLATMKTSLDIFHDEFPVFEFPFHHFVIFNGLQGGGMEFAGMANNNEISAAAYKEYLGIDVTDEQANLGLTLHEMCHMYFPFLMGINEKKYAWMDEGFASFSSYFIETLYEEKNADLPYMGSQRILPAMTPSYLMQGSGFNSYTIGNMANIALYELLGEEQFIQSMQSFMETWQYKHPTPYDYFFSFNESTGQHLNWFWNQWYFDWGYMDIGITGLEDDILTVENIGGRPMNFGILITYENGDVVEESIRPSVWENARQYQHKVKDGKDIAAIALQIPGGSDANGKNNVWEKE